MVVPNTDTLQIPAAIYARKSTDAKLEQEVNSISVQCAAARSFIESQRHQGWHCIDEELCDNNKSGATLERPALRRLMQLIKKGKIKIVVVNRLDRISRSLSQFLELMDFFEEHGVALVSVTQNINTATPMGRLMLSIIMSFSEFERELICERVTERMHAARRNGQFIGGRPILGYNIKPEGRALEIDELEAIRVREIFALYLELRSVKAVVQELNKRGWKNKKWITREGKVAGGTPFSVATLHYLLRNQVYRGNVTLKGEIYDGQHEGIVDPEIFERVKKTLAGNDLTKGQRRRNAHDALLKGLLKCKSCGTAFVHTGSKKKTNNGHKYYRYYTCATKRLNTRSCPSPSIPAGDIEKLVADQLMGIGTDPVLQETVYEQLSAAIDEKQRSAEQVRKTAERELARITKELDSSTEFEASETLLLHLEHKRQEAEEALENAEKQTYLRKPSKDEIIATVRDMARLWPSFNEGEKCAFVKALVREVEYDAGEGKLDIHFNESGFAGGES